jgi:hypothetical protein
MLYQRLAINMGEYEELFKIQPQNATSHQIIYSSTGGCVKVRKDIDLEFVRILRHSVVAEMLMPGKKRKLTMSRYTNQKTSNPTAESGKPKQTKSH